jgi:transcriptional regulator with XRE-family HTH domain
MEQPVGTTLGERLRARRLQMGATLLTVATTAGVSVPYLANLEKGRGNPTLDVIVNVARALRVAPAELLARNGPEDLIDDVFIGLPSILVDLAHGKVFAARVEQLAEALSVDVEDAQRKLVLALASTPLRIGDELTDSDCRRLLDAYTLILLHARD